MPRTVHPQSSYDVDVPDPPPSLQSFEVPDPAMVPDPQPDEHSRFTYASISLNAIFPKYRLLAEVYGMLIVSRVDPKNAIMPRLAPNVVGKSAQLSGMLALMYPLLVSFFATS